MNTVKSLRVFFLLVLVLTLLVPGLAKKKSLPGVWTESPVIIDGQANDWQDVTLLKQKK